MFSLCSAPFGNDPYRTRIGRRLTPPLTTHSSSPAPPVPSCLVSHSLHRHFALQFWLQWLSLFMMLRFDSNPWSEPKKVLLTASARFAQRTGVFALVLVALPLAEALTILTGMLTAMRNLACFDSVVRLLHSISKSFSAKPQPTPARASNAPNPPAHARMF